MSVIEVTPERLEIEAEHLFELKGQHEAEMNKLRALINGLETQWTGKSYAAFIDEFNAMQHSFEEFSLLLEAYANLMKSSAFQLQQTDGSMRNIFLKI